MASHHCIGPQTKLLSVDGVWMGDIYLMKRSIKMQYIAFQTRLGKTDITASIMDFKTPTSLKLMQL